MKFIDSHISIAVVTDAQIITKLLNSAYRGEVSKKGWTTEADLIAGEQRTNTEEVEKLILQKDSVFIIYINQSVNGCVNLQWHGNKIYLGMLSVNPDLQNSGVGKKLLQASEEYAKYKNAAAIYMTVIDVRKELIDWYKRHGYADTGERKPFIEDDVSGKHLQELQFMFLEKKLN